MAERMRYDGERAARVLDGLRDGLTRAAAAARAGLVVERLERWMSARPGFAADVALAEGEAEARFTAVLALAAQPQQVVERRTVTRANGAVEVTETVRKEFDWRAAQAWLRARRPRDWDDGAVRAAAADGSAEPVVVKVLRGASMDEI